MLFSKDTSFLLRAAATANLGQRRYWFWLRARPGDWSLCGSRFVEAVHVLGRPLDPLGTRALFGMLLGALNMGLHC